MLRGPNGPLLFCAFINIHMITFKEHLKETRMEKRRAAVDKAREYVEGIARELAADHDNYESFSRHMAKLVSQLEFGPGGTVILPDETGPIHIDLKWMWQHHNPEEQEKFRDAWDDYGRARARGEYASRDGWTGD